MTWCRMNISSNELLSNSIVIGHSLFNSSSAGQNDRHFADDIFRCIFVNGYEMMHKAWSSIEHRRGALLFLKVIRQISRSHGSKKRRIWPRLGVSGLLLQFEFTNGYEMMHKAWSSIEKVPYWFLRSSVKFQGHTALKSVEFDPVWAFLDCNSSLYSPMATKWCKKLKVA